MVNIRIYTDEQLLALMKDGGPHLDRAYRYLLEREKSKYTIRKIIFSKGGKQEDYEEILNDALIALYSGVISGRFTLQSPIQSYMNGIAKNLWYKRCSRKGLVISEMDFEKEDAEPSIEVKIISEERRKILLSFMGRLGEKCQRILIKAFIEGYKNSELVALLNYKNEAVVRKTKSQCLKRLLEIFKDQPEQIKYLKI